MRDSTNLIPFFLIGLPRSGTTALANLINQSAHMSCLSYEGNFLYQLWKALNRKDVFEEPLEDLSLEFQITADYNLIERAQRLGNNETTFSSESVARLVNGLNQDLYAKSIPFIFHRTANRFFQELSVQASRQIVGDKVPRYIEIPDKLSAALPCSKIVYIVRDPRAVVHSSLIFGKSTLHLFTAPSAFAMSVSLVAKTIRMKSFIKTLPKDRLCCVHHQDFLNRPFKIFAELTEFFERDANLESPIKIKAALQHVTKDWTTEMALDDVAAVEAVCTAANLALPSDLSIEGKSNPWKEKAESVIPLLSSPAEDVPRQVESLKTTFKQGSDPNTLALTLSLMAEDCHTRTDFEKAHIFHKQALALLPSNPVLLFRFAELCFDQKLLDQAENLYQKVESIAPTGPFFGLLRAKAAYKLGRIARLRSHYTTARKYFTQSLAIYPEYRQANAMLAASSNK